jgi:predicted amino acid racemase
MFLKPLMRRNEMFLRTIAEMHASGGVPANSFTLDLDTVTKNARIMASEAHRLNLKVFAMTKQMGRNIDFCNALAEGGISAAVAVDMDCARAVANSRLTIGHLGHLVQVPSHEAAEASGLNPAYWTIFNLEKAREAASAALTQSRKQDLLVRIYDENDEFYFGHGGGLPAKEVIEIADSLDNLEGARFAGITTFPALLFSEGEGEVRETPNLKTIERTRKLLEKRGGAFEVNTPGTNSSVLFQMLSDAGSTQVEPGHALTGSTPLHAIREDLPEIPAAAYVTEVSHEFLGKFYCFGGGLYIDPVFASYQINCLVAPRGNYDDAFLAEIEIPEPAAIDYYGLITPPVGKTISVGDTVILGFRIQAFVTRANVVAIRGVHSGRPEIMSISNGFGTESLFALAQQKERRRE